MKTRASPILVPAGALAAIFQRRCPSCRIGKVYRHLFSLHKRCPSCGYDYHPEPGFYLGAMMVPYFFTAILTLPFAIYLYVDGYQGGDLMWRLAIYYAGVVSVMLFYARAAWLHIEFRISRRLGNRNDELQ